MKNSIEKESYRLLHGYESKFNKLYINKQAHQNYNGQVQKTLHGKNPLTPGR